MLFVSHLGSERLDVRGRDTLGTMSSPSALALGLFVVGYPTSVAVISRFVPVVRQRRVRWFAAHQLGVAAVVAGWAVERQWVSVAFNSAWLVSATAWWVVGGRQTR